MTTIGSSGLRNRVESELLLTYTADSMRLSNRLYSLFLLLSLTLLIGCFDTVQSLVADAREAYERKDYREARSLLNRALLKDPSDKDALVWMGQTFRRESQYDSALFYLKRADILYPKDRDLNLILYEVAYAMQDWKVAIGATLTLIGTGDPQEQHYARLSELWDREQHPYNAFFWLKKLMATSEPKRDMYITAARLSAQCDSPAQALVYLDTAIMKFGSDPELQMNRAVYLTESNRHPQAEIIFRDLLKQDSLNPLNYLNLAHNLSDQKTRAKLTEALKLYREVQPRVSQRYGVDSMIQVVESTLTALK